MRIAPPPQTTQTQKPVSKRVKPVPSQVQSTISQSRNNPTALPREGQLWRQATDILRGRPRQYASPEALWTRCQEYFTWVEENPMYDCKAMVVDKILEYAYTPKRRPMTLGGLCLFLNIHEDTWTLYRNRPEFIGVCGAAERTIREQKFAGAASGFFNHAIIARDLGLADKKEVTGAEGQPLIPPAQMDERAKRTRAAMLAALVAEGVEG